MPNKKQRGNPGRRGGGRGSRTTRVPFHAIDPITLAAGSNSLPCSPNNSLSSRLAGIADDFDEYRLIKLRYRVRIDNTSSSSPAGAAFYPGVLTTAPTTIATLGENPYISVRFATDDVVLPYTVIPRGILAGEQSWYKAQKAPITADDAIPGTIYFVGTGSDVINLEVDGMFEFRGESDPVNTPAPVSVLVAKMERLAASLEVARRLEAEAAQKERTRLLKLLSFTETSTINSVPTSSVVITRR